MKYLSTSLSLFFAAGAACALAVEEQSVPATADDHALVEHGSYIVHRVAMCVQCHTPRDQKGDLVESRLLKGAQMPVTSPFHYQVWAFMAPPLAGLPTGYTEDDLVTLLTQGRKPNGTAPRHPMPPFRFDEHDARAVAAYLMWMGKTGDGRDITLTEQGPVERAVCALQPTEGSTAHGVVIFTLQNGIMHIRASVTGLSPGLHGFNILERRDCDKTDALSTTKHLNPDNRNHGSPDTDQHHLGDMGNIVADETGRAYYERLDNRMTFEGEHSIIGHAIVIQTNWDDLKPEPDGASGPAVTCGVIEKIK